MIHNQPQQAEKWVTMSHNDPVEPLQPIINNKTHGFTMKYNEPLWKCGKMYLNEPGKMCLNELQ